VLRAGVDFGPLPLGARQILEVAEAQRNQAKLAKVERKKLKRPRDDEAGQAAACAAGEAVNGHSLGVASCSRSVCMVGFGLSGGGAPPAKRPRQAELNGGGTSARVISVIRAAASTPMVGPRARAGGKAEWGRGNERERGSSLSSRMQQQQQKKKKKKLRQELLQRPQKTD
jgi:hypothetical protein